MRTLPYVAAFCLCFAPATGRPPAEVPKALRVAAVQLRSTRDLDANVAAHAAWLKRCAADRVDVAVFPECSVTGYFDDLIPKLTAKALAEAEAKVAAACKEHRIWAVVGSPVRDGDRLFNSAVVIDDAGKVRERYHKVQLAERWPTPGDHLSVFRVKGVPCSVIVCHDERYPELVRLPVLAGARVVFYLSHESPITQEHKVGPYRAQIQARAVENTVYVAHANAPANRDATGSHGHSRLIDPDGVIVHEAGVFTEEAVTATFDLRRATGGNALRSVSRGPLGDWWREGVKRVRVVD
ncbi:MAG: carbon-nitrogen hydrolase family protein [Gemmataceae bacterium]